MRTSPRSRALLSAVVMVVLATQFSVAHSAERMSVVVRGAIVGIGLIEKMGQSFSKKPPHYKVIVSPAKGEAALQQFLSKEADISLLMRPLTPAEVNTARKNGIELKGTLIGYAAPIIVTHPRNPVKDLTMAQLRSIFTGAVTNWSQVNGPDENISVLCLSPKRTKPGKMFLKIVLHMKPFAGNARMLKYGYKLVKECASSKGLSIGFLPYSLWEVSKDREHVKVLALRKDESSPAVIPSQATFKDGSYPVALRLFLYWDGKTRHEGAKRFAEFCSAKGAIALSGAKE